MWTRLMQYVLPLIMVTALTTGISAYEITLQMAKPVYVYMWNQRMTCFQVTLAHPGMVLTNSARDYVIAVSPSFNAYEVPSNARWCKGTLTKDITLQLK
jgi:hypothetical protein